MDMRKSGLVSGSDSGAFTDLNRLNNLKVGDRESDGNMRKVAQEFESLFLNEMLKSMRSANEVLGKGQPAQHPRGQAVSGNVRPATVGDLVPSGRRHRSG